MIQLGKFVGAGVVVVGGGVADTNYLYPAHAVAGSKSIVFSKFYVLLKM